MNYSRKIAAAALAGIIGAGVVALNRDAISRLIHIADWKKRIKKLENWYQGYMTEIDEYAGMGVDHYLYQHRDQLRSVARRKKYAKKRTQAFLMSVGEDARKLIVAHQKGQVAKRYSEYLYDLDTKRGYNAALEARAYKQEAAKLADELRTQGCVVDPLFMDLRITPPD